MNLESGQVEAFRRRLEELSLPPLPKVPAGGPFVVALEGPNGAGKTTLCAALARALGASSCLGTDPAWFAEPFKTRMIRDADWHASALFFLSGCFEQMRLLRSRREPLVIMDRSLWSTLAVQAAYEPQRLEILLEVLRPLAAQVRVPELTLVLEVSLATCCARIARKSVAARTLDQLTADEQFHQRERDFYRWLGHQASGFLFLPADEATPEELCAKAQALLGLHAPC